MTTSDLATGLGLHDDTALSSFSLGNWGAAATLAPCATADDDADDGDDAGAEDRDAGVPEDGPEAKAENFRLDGDRALAATWRKRALDNVAAIRLARAIEAGQGAARPDRHATRAEQAALARFVGFGAGALANACFRQPGEETFREGWQEIGESLAAAAGPDELPALMRATQYAHFTPEWIVRAAWSALAAAGFAGGRILEPGMGTGLFWALMPAAAAARSRLVGVERDPTTARIARLLFPKARVHQADFAHLRLRPGFDLAIGNPPFSDRVVRGGDPAWSARRLRLHDYFIARAVSLLRPGGLALFVTSAGTLDKADDGGRRAIAEHADLVAAVRLPEGTFRATAGTEVGVDLILLRRRAEGEAGGDEGWLGTADLPPVPGSGADDATAQDGWWRVNQRWLDRPETVLGRHALVSGQFGPAYACVADEVAEPLAERLARALAAQIPPGLYREAPEAAGTGDEDEENEPPEVAVGRAADGARIKEGSFTVDPEHGLMQVVDGRPVRIQARENGRPGSVTPKQARVVRALIPIRDAVRAVIRAQAADLDWGSAQTRLRVAYMSFARQFGPINRTEVEVRTDPQTGEEREHHRRPNLAPFLDDPDCWLVASVEEYDPESGRGAMGPIFRERVIAPPAEPVIRSAADALAVCLSRRGRVDPDAVADLLDATPEAAMAALGDLVYEAPGDLGWQTADAYLSGPVRTKLAAAEAAAALEPRFARNVAALRAVQPADLGPADVTARLGAPWIETADIERFAAEVLDTTTTVRHVPAAAAWSVDLAPFAGRASSTTEWGTPRRNAGELLHAALSSATPQVHDTVDGKPVLNAEATEAAKEKLAKIKDAFEGWVWTDPERARRLLRVYNACFNNQVDRRFDGSHLELPGASKAFVLRPHQKAVVWRIVCTGNTYIAHVVGAGKTLSYVAAVMEQKRLGLIRKAWVVVPGHCLAQVSREFLQLYPQARILVADEEAFARDKRRRFLARAATDSWDAIVITQSAFKLIAAPGAFERRMIQAQVADYAAVLAQVDDGIGRKRLENLKEKLQARLERLAARKDDMICFDEIGGDQIIADEAQAYRKLSFATNQTTLKGVAPDGSDTAWDLLVKARYLRSRNPGRELVMASGTPITATLGELYTLQRFQDPAALAAAGLAEFDPWAATFGQTRTELELQPSGTYKPVTRFAQFTNVADLMAMFRAFADVQLKQDLRQHLTLPRIKGGQRQIVTAEPSPAFRAYQRQLAERIRAIENRRGRAKPGDDIILTVIGDGRHAAIDLRLVDPDAPDEPGNKLNTMIQNAFAIWQQTSALVYARPDGTPYPVPGAIQLIFSDLGTLSAEATRGFSVYRWIKQELVRLGVPAAQVAFMQDHKKAAAKQRLFDDVNAGRVRVVIGSTQTMGTGTNVQKRLIALHHLDATYLPADIEQREGRAERQGNQNPEIGLYAYATRGSTDAAMWQFNERRMRFIEAALSGDRSIRRLDDMDSQADQFAQAKAIASGDERLMQRAGLEAEIARLQRQRAAHLDSQHTVRWAVLGARSRLEEARARIPGIEADIARRQPTRGEQFAMTVAGTTYTDRTRAGTALLVALEDARRGWAGRTREVGEIGGFRIRGQAAESVLRGTSEPRLALACTGHDLAVDASGELTARGLVARLENALERLDEDLAWQRRREAEAAATLAEFAGHLDRPFPLQAELDDKLHELADLDRALAATGEDANPSLSLAPD